MQEKINDINELEQPTKLYFTAANGTDSTYGSFYMIDGASCATITDYKHISGINCSTTPLANHAIQDAMIKDWGFEPKSVAWQIHQDTDNDWESRFNSISCGRPYMYYVDHQVLLVADHQELKLTTHIQVSFNPEKHEYELTRSRVLHGGDTEATWIRFRYFVNSTEGTKEFGLE